MNLIVKSVSTTPATLLQLALAPSQLTKLMMVITRMARDTHHWQNNLLVQPSETNCTVQNAIVA
jgi:hypothetical protein